ncbi:trans-sulfuration enzyme family protein [Paludibacterium yongneupense]|uniref:trans-sulfuration enzyme family protein n=1 Tax=Paludibacterium yongneupense TaxID=400061 RepID=UPI001B7FF0A0|nr:aminotransferase class I/II-fold pyridoxal phosphate-dependent enzyme [Paludibacterium yongneupense]
MSRLETRAIHAGASHSAVGDPVLNILSPATSFYSHPDAVGFSANDLGDQAPYFYTRWSNPTTDLLAERLAALEGGEAGLTFSSGMAAISSLFLNRLRCGDHVIVSNVCYAGVAELARDILPKYGIRSTAVDTSDLAAIEAALRPETRLIHIETPANPILKLSDIAAIAALAHANGVECSVDSTMATPVATTPLALGADFVVHSLTKYIGGHSDALGGAIIGRKADLDAIQKEGLIHFGATLNPFAAWLILRGMETLPLRMKAHEANAGAVAAFLAAHPRVEQTYWPGLASHPQHELARRQMRNFSGMVSFSAKNGAALARQLAERVEVFSYAVSLGKTRSLLCYVPSDDIIRSSFGLEGRDAENYRAWTGDGTFRLSVGLEAPEDLIADLERALD